MGSKIYRKFQKAQKTDQYETPDWVMKQIKKKINKSENQIFDLCLFQEGWNAEYYFDALFTEWPLRMNWANIPFSHALPFLIKAFIEYLKGKEVVLIMPTNQLIKKKIYHDYLKPLIFYEKIGEVAFKKDGKIDKDYERDCCLVYFL